MRCRQTCNLGLECTYIQLLQTESCQVGPSLVSIRIAAVSTESLLDLLIEVFVTEYETDDKRSLFTSWITLYVVSHLESIDVKKCYQGDTVRYHRYLQQSLDERGEFWRRGDLQWVER